MPKRPLQYLPLESVPCNPWIQNFSNKWGRTWQKITPKAQDMRFKNLLVACGVIIMMVIVGIEQETKRRSIVQNQKVFKTIYKYIYYSMVMGNGAWSSNKKHMMFFATPTLHPVQNKLIEHDPQTFKGELWCKPVANFLQGWLQSNDFSSSQIVDSFLKLKALKARRGDSCLKVTKIYQRHLINSWALGG